MDSTTVSLSSKLKDIKFPYQVASSPYSVKAFTPATPLSLAIEMKNWLNKKVQEGKDALNENGFPKTMAKHLTYCKEGTGEIIKSNIVKWKQAITKSIQE